MSPLCIVLLVCGCRDCNTNDPLDTPVPGQRGVLQNGEFLYGCLTESDPVCRQEPTRFPDCIALSGSFRLAFEPMSGPDASVVSLSSHYFASVGGSDFEARRVGTSALLATRTEEVVDYLSLDIVEPDAVEIRDSVTDSASSTVLLRTGATKVFDVIPLSQTCDPVGGSLSFSATSSDEDVVSASMRNGLELFAESPGEASVTVEVGTILRTLDVIVSNPPTRWPPGSTDTDTTGTTGTTGGGTTATNTATEATTTSGTATGTGPTTTTGHTATGSTTEGSGS